jgi:cytochrome c-type biogenesis protein CcmH
MSASPLKTLKSQLAQLDALISEGVLKGDAAKKSRDDLERQLLAAVLKSTPTPGAEDAELAAAPAEPRVRAPRALVAGVTVFVLAFAVAGYAWLGNRAGWQVSPGETGETAEAAQAPGHASADPAEQKAQMNEMLAKLVERLKTQPDDADGWQMLARSYGVQGRYAEAVVAHKRLLALKPQDAQVLADYADTLAMANNRSLDGEPEALILRAVKLDPSNVKALALAGTVAFNHADYKGAVTQWERAVQLADPASGYAQQLQGALAEARQRGGMPAVAAAAPGAPGGDLFAAPAAEPAAPGAAAADTPAVAAGQEAITGRVTLKPELKGKVGPDDVVFIFARAPTGSKMPLAILRKKVSDLPLDFKLDDSLAMSPASKLSTASQVVVGARISKTGNAMAGPGDLQVLSAPMALGARNVRIEITDAVR